jgi:hypothetical protein
MIQLQATTDGLDGALLAWADGPAPRANRILANGSLAPGWSPFVQLVDAAAVPSTFQIATGIGGGLISVWTDARSPGGSRVRARWIQADGTPDPSQPDSGLRVTPAGKSGHVLGARGDGTGDVYVGWESSVPTNWWEKWISKVSYAATTGVPLQPTHSSLALSSPWPNPTGRDVLVRVTLTDESPARLELLDLAGRLVSVRSVQGAGEHLERFERLGRLPSGVYLMRVAQGRSVATRRVALVH